MGKFQEFVTAKNWDQQTSGAAFRTFLNLELWEDLRIAVAGFKQIDPLEIVFMSLLNEGHFDNPKQSWQFDLHAGWFFQDVEVRANNALHLDQIFADDCTSEEIMQNVIVAGTDLMLQLVAREYEITTQQAVAQAQFAKQTAARTTQPQTVASPMEQVPYVTVVEPVYYTRTYYDVYIGDPFYIAPIWYDQWYW